MQIPAVEKRLLGRPRHTWVDNIKMDLGEREWVGVHLIGLAQDWDQWTVLVNAVMNLQDLLSSAV
jgi:hypothetical protein